MMDDYPIKSPRKLIEVALPLDTINTASIRESYIYRGNPSALHKWWAQRPLAACRAVLFAQLVNDPSWKWELEHPRVHPPSHLIASWSASRKRLFSIIEDLVIWENTTNDAVLQKARNEVDKSWKETCELNAAHPDSSLLFNPDCHPAVCDPFAGGGTIPLEAQRLGLHALSSDLNPIAVLLNKAMIEIPQRFREVRPVGAKSGSSMLQEWQHAEGLREDIKYYGGRLRHAAIERVGALYPPIEVTPQMAKGRSDLANYVGRTLPVMAWLWTRTVRSPNPAFDKTHIPLAATFMLSTKSGREVYVEPVIDDSDYRLELRFGKPDNLKKVSSGTKILRGANFRCLLSGSPIEPEYIRTEAKAGRMRERLMAVVVEGDRGRLYLPPCDSFEDEARQATPEWKPDGTIVEKHRAFTPTIYGFTKWSDLFTNRQLVAMTTLCDLITEMKELIASDAVSAGMENDERRLRNGGTGATAYSEAVALYLSFSLSKVLDYNCSLVPWYTKEDRPGHLFSKQAVPIVWDYAELNPLSTVGGSWAASIKIVANALSGCWPSGCSATAEQVDVLSLETSAPVVFSTDPPYYDNVPYADLSDFFYVWLRRTVKETYPDLFATMAVPKAEELVATPGRQGGKRQAEEFFLNGMTRAMCRLANQSHPAFPVTIYYAFKQSESAESSGTTSTGWETFLEAVIRAGFVILGTWPARTERGSRSRGIGSNALASSIVLVCRRRVHEATTISRREFIRELNQVLPAALDDMTRGVGEDWSPVAPVDLSQAIIGPGMAVFSKYSAVLEADGEPMTVRTALQLINRFLAEDDFDKDTQFCLHWFEQYGWDEGVFGEADVLARAKATAVDALDEAGVIQSGGGLVRLLRWSEYPTDWDPTKDSHTPVWEALHHLIRGLKHGSEIEAGQMLAGVQSQAEAARQLAYRLYTLCERKGWAEDAGAYNELITSWSGIETATPRVEQRELF